VAEPFFPFSFRFRRAGPVWSPLEEGRVPGVTPCGVGSRRTQHFRKEQPSSDSVVFDDNRGDALGSRDHFYLRNAAVGLQDHK